MMLATARTSIRIAGCCYLHHNYKAGVLVLLYRSEASSVGSGFFGVRVGSCERLGTKAEIRGVDVEHRLQGCVLQA